MEKRRNFQVFFIDRPDVDAEVSARSIISATDDIVLHSVSLLSGLFIAFAVPEIREATSL